MPPTWRRKKSYWNGTTHSRIITAARLLLVPTDFYTYRSATVAGRTMLIQAMYLIGMRLMKVATDKTSKQIFSETFCVSILIHPAVVTGFLPTIHWLTRPASTRSTHMVSAIHTGCRSIWVVINNCMLAMQASHSTRRSML